MLSSESTYEPNYTELFHTILNSIQSKRISFINDLNIIGIGFLFNAIKLNIILESNNFHAVLKLLFNSIRSTEFITSHELMTVVLIFEHLIFRTNEIYIKKQVEIYLKSLSTKSTVLFPMIITSSFTPSLSEDFDAYDYFITEVFEFFKKSVNVLNTTQFENKQFLRNLEKCIIMLRKLSKFSEASKSFCGLFRRNKKFLAESLLSKVSSLIIPFYIDAGFDSLEFLQIINEISSKPEDVKSIAVKKICNTMVRILN